MKWRGAGPGLHDCAWKQIYYLLIFCTKKEDRHET